MNALPLRVTSTEQRTNLVIRRGKKMHSDILVTIREPKRKKKRSLCTNNIIRLYLVHKTFTFVRFERDY